MRYKINNTQLFCQFSITVVINSHKFISLKEYSFIILQFSNSQVQHQPPWAKTRCLQGYIHSFHSFLQALGHFIDSCRSLRLPIFLGSWPLPPSSGSAMASKVFLMLHLFDPFSIVSLTTTRKVCLLLRNHVIRLGLSR